MGFCLNFSNNYAIYRLEMEVVGHTHQCRRQQIRPAFRTTEFHHLCKGNMEAFLGRPHHVSVELNNINQ